MRKLGNGWKANVWENIGWHYAALSPDRNIRVMTSRSPGTYVAFLNVDCEYGLNPKIAVAAVIKKALEDLHRKSKMLSEVQDIYEEIKEGIRKS